MHDYLYSIQQIQFIAVLYHEKGRLVERVHGVEQLEFPQRAPQLIVLGHAVRNQVRARGH